jgi:hypothetical protein
MRKVLVAGLALVVVALGGMLVVEVRAVPARAEVVAAPRHTTEPASEPARRPAERIGKLPPARVAAERPLADPRFDGKTRTQWRAELSRRMATMQDELEQARQALGPLDSDMAWTPERGQAQMRVRDLELRLERDRELLRDLEAAR